MDYTERLLTWFDAYKREMPWRNTNDPYAIWVSEIMLQQTQVDTVIPYYNKFMGRFPTVHSLASAPLEEVYKYWEGLGYYRRAENLHKGAKMVDEQYGGVFPGDIEQVKKIPGIGPYTLGAILSIAFHIPLPAVDGNVMRILARQFLIDEDISITKNRKIFEDKVMELMPEDPNRFNQALMELGALVCTPKTPKCSECPVSTLCKGHINGSALQYPVKTKKIKNPSEFYYAILFKKGNTYWMEKRPEEGLLARLWGFPLVEKEGADNIINKACYYEVLQDVSHVFTHKKWEMTPIIIEWEKTLFSQLTANTELGAFVTLEEMKSYPIATAFKKIIKKVIKEDLK